MTEQPINKLTSSGAMLNLVVKRVPSYNKFTWNVGLWSAIYEEIADPQVRTTLNAHTNVGALFKIKKTGEQSDFDATYKMIGTAFLLAPNIGVTALHVVENSIIANEKVYFVPLHDKPFRHSEMYFFHDEGKTRKIERFYNADVEALFSEFPTTQVDPALKTDVTLRLGHGKPDVCLFSLESPLEGTSFMIPDNALKCHVATLGVPSWINQSYVTSHNLPLSVSAYNNHVDAGERSVYYCASVGSIVDVAKRNGGADRLIATNQCVPHDCYTHPGNSGSAIVSLNKPSRVIGLHIGESIYPEFNIMLPLSNPVFASCYVRHVFPVLRDLVSGDDKVDFIKYLAFAVQVMSSKPEFYKLHLEEYLRANHAEQYGIPTVTMPAAAENLPSGLHHRVSKVYTEARELSLEEEKILIERDQQVHSWEQE